MDSGKASSPSSSINDKDSGKAHTPHSSVNSSTSLISDQQGKTLHSCFYNKLL